MSAARDRLISALAPRVAYAYILLLRATVRLQYHNREVLEQIGDGPGHGQHILAFWHSRFVMMPYGCMPKRIVALISMHRDSRMLGDILERFGVTLAFGSSTVGGARGLREVLRKVQDGYDVGIAPDGPQGPRRRIKPGLLTVARLTGLPIVPLGFSARPARRLASWDRTLVPYPFGRAVFLYGDPIRVPRDSSDAERDRLQVLLEAELDRVTDLADMRVGLQVEEVRPAVGL